MRRALVLAFFAAGVVTLDPGGLLASFEQRTLDARYRAHAAPTPFTDRIVILDITEESIVRLAPLYGRWPWPRALHGEVVEYLARDGAAAIGFDLLFAEPVNRREVDTAEWEGLAALAANADLPEVRTELATRLEALRPDRSDEEFVASVARAGNVFQAAAFAESVRPEDTTLARGPDAGDAAGAPLPGMVSVVADDRVVLRPHTVLPFAALARASRGVGHINVLPDSDGTYRRFAPLVWWRDRRHASPALGLALAAHVKGVPLAAVQRTSAGLTLSDVVLPLLADGSAWLHYQGGVVETDASGRGTFRSFYQHLAYEDVLAAKDLTAAGKPTPLAPGAFKDKIVLISALAAGLSDLRATPFSPVTPGIELHANIIDSLLSGRLLHAPSASVAFLLTFAACLIVAALAQVLRLGAGFPAALGVVAAWAGAAWLAFGAGWVLPLVTPVVAMSLAYGSVLLVRAVSTERERRWLRTAFGHYLAPTVLDELVRSPDKLRLGGERRHMTVLFSDVAGFTTLSEKLSPEEVSTLLNGYLDRMTACVLETRGTLDKFVGDAVMAEWNAPLEQPDHAARACETALRMLDEVARQNPTWQAAGALLDIRIGINTGDMVVGNMGSHQVFDYTVIGNEVNTAARLEPLNKTFATRIIVAGATRREAEAERPGVFTFRSLASVMPKGRATPLEIHELVGKREALASTTVRNLGTFEQAMEHYLAQRFDEALVLFRTVQKREPSDGPAAFFATLCEGYLASPPPADWSGAYEQTEK